MKHVKPVYRRVGFKGIEVNAKFELILKITETVIDFNDKCKTFFFSVKGRSGDPFEAKYEFAIIYYPL